VDQVCGPIFVQGAAPGDTLQVELLDFTPGDWGWTAAIPGFGLLADQFPEPALRISRIADGAAELLPGLRVPTAPFCGCLGLARMGRHAYHPPTELGGNMDTFGTHGFGAVLWLPVAVPGALFSLGMASAGRWRDRARPWRR
jgi:acetamidase/formamidase